MAGEELFIREALAAVVMLSIWSTMYKVTPVYEVLEHLVLGIVVGNTIIVNLDSYLKLVGTPVMAGDLVAIVAIVASIALLTYYIPGHGNIYRYVFTALVAVAIGTAFSGRTSLLWFKIIGLAKATLTDPWAILIIVSFIISGFYFFFSKTFGERVPRNWGMYVLAAFWGWTVTASWFQRVNVIVGWGERLMTGPGLYVSVVFLILILVDITVSWRRIQESIGLTVKPQAKA